jgi:hypothetical protein
MAKEIAISEPKKPESKVILKAEDKNGFIYSANCQVV